MKHGWWAAVLAAGLVISACNDAGPAGPGEPRIEFTITAPTQIASKSVVDVEVNILASRVQRPLIVSFEKANVGEPFFEVGTYILTDDERTAVAPVPVFMDPRIRVTVMESSPAQVSVSKTIQIDVVDFP